MLRSSIYVTIPTNVTVAELMLDTIKQHGNKVAIINAHTDQQYTYADIHQRITRAGSALRRRGLTKSHVMCFYSANSMDYSILMLALTSTGAVGTAINPASTVDESVRHMKLTNTQYIVCDDERLAKALEAARVLGGIKEIFVFGKADGSATSTDDLFADAGDMFRHEPLDPTDDVYCILPSSGTTGPPKGVMLTHFNFLHPIVTLSSPNIKLISNRGHARVLLFAPFFHVYGLAYNAMLWLAGETVVIMAKFDLPHYLSSISKYKITCLPVVPPVAVLLVKDERVSNYDLSSVTDITCGAASLKLETVAELSRKMGVPVRQMYGMTESTGLGTFSPTDNWKTGSVGVLFPTTAGQVVEPNSGRVLGANETGEICLRTQAIMKGYIGDETATGQTIDSHGWLHTGDIGYFDEDNHLYITGRIKELIKYKGYQVSPVELEGLLLEHPAVADVAVIGMPDDEAGELPRALVVVKDGYTVTPGDIDNFLREKVSPHKWLRGGVHFVSSIAKSPSGKILRLVLLAEQLAKHKAQAKL